MLGVSVLCLAVTPASAAALSATGTTEATFIAEFVILILVGRVFGEAMQRLGQPAITGQLLAGIVLGPSVFGAIWPEFQKAIFPSAPEQKAMIDAVSQLGILMLLLLTGMETDLRLVRKVGPAAVAISITGILVPFFCGFALGQLLPHSILPAGPRLIPSLFLGTALSISSVKIVALVVREMNFVRRDLGQVIIASAIIEDTIGWVIIAVTFGIAGHGSLDLLTLAKSVIGIGLFLGISFTFGRRIIFGLIRWANDSFRSEFPVITMILIIMGVMAEITQFLGVHTVLGAFVAGVLIGESPILTQHVEDQLRGLITAFFMPVFFGVAGLSADLTILNDPSLAVLTVGFVLIASIGKFIGAFLGGKIGRLTFRQSVAVGTAMNARGSTEIIVASIGLSMGVLTQNLFTLIVTMAILTTTAMPPMLRRALAAIPMGADEKKRVDRETLDERGFVTNLERMLLAVDDSSIGKFTARIAGLIAGARGMPLTIVRLDEQSVAVESSNGPSQQVKEGAKASATVMRKDDAEPDPEKVHLITRAATQEVEGAIIEESRKGFDLMLVGVAETHNAEGVFDEKVTKLTKGFKGAVVIMASRGTNGVHNLDKDLRILVPINGSPMARRAAEIAFAIARPIGARVTALYVSAGDQTSGGRVATRSREEGALKDIAELGERYDVQLLTALEPKSSADSAILKRAANGYGLIVMGVSQTPGDQLFLGNTANAILKKWTGAVLLVAT
jgi:Kef-type K+ transport system membrane component KefB/nucleotide-binding universal stress UspA family protein